MPIRLQDTEEWNSHFVRGLKGPYKAFWFFLKSACNHAGVWEVDLDLARMRTGFFEEINQTDAEIFFSPKILVLSCREKWFIPSFIADQHKTMTLNPANTYHRGACNILRPLGLLDENNTVLTEQLQAPLKPQQSTLQGAKGMDKEIVKEIVKEKTNAKKNKIVDSVKPETIEPIIIAEIITNPVPKYDDLTLEEAIKGLKEARVKKRAPMTDLAVKLMLNKLKKLAGDDEELKIAIVMQTIRRGWSDVFELKEEFLQDFKAAKMNKTQNAISLANGFVYQEVTA